MRSDITIVKKLLIQSSFQKFYALTGKIFVPVLVALQAAFINIDFCFIGAVWYRAVLPHGSVRSARREVAFGRKLLRTPAVLTAILIRESC